MRLVCLCAALVSAVTAAFAEAQQPTAAELADAFQKISVDPSQTYRVRDLQFSRGGVNIYLNEGVLAFATPLDSRTVAAVFTTHLSEAGDAEILLLPPQRGERASLVSFIKSPNLDEHFGFAVFLFSDATATELMEKIKTTSTRRSADAAAQDDEGMNVQLRAVMAESGMRLIEALLDNHAPEAGFFYGFFAGQRLRSFDVFYEPSDAEPVTVGQPVRTQSGVYLQLWTSYRPRQAKQHTDSEPQISEYRIEATIRKDLGLEAVARFKYAAEGTTGRALALGLSEKLRVKAASIDGKAAEIFQPETLHLTERERGRSFLLIAKTPLSAGVEHSVEVHYEGNVIRQVGDGGYFVDERNVWYPYLPPMRTDFDLTFRFPSHLTLVSTGDLISEEAANGVRIVHRRTKVPEGLAGFNLGDYKSSVEEHGRYRVEVYAEQKSLAQSLEIVARKTETVLDDYSQRWMPLPIHPLAVTPIAGTFGQGFPGLIYLSTLAYMRPEDRPAQVRTATLDTFFSDMMLPHEVAHQWWGNGVIAEDYRTDWLLEAMANFSALQVLQSTRGAKAAEAVLNSYRADLLEKQDGQTVESMGPVDFGGRLIDTAGLRTWHKIIYEKGTWVLNMLRERLGDEGFRRMQVKLLEEFKDNPVSNEKFRRVASEFLPAGQPDRDLSLFFDAWIYGTGLPQLTLTGASKEPSLELAGVEEDFLVDVPLRCREKSGNVTTLWVRANKGTNLIENKPAGSVCDLPAPGDYLYSR